MGDEKQHAPPLSILWDGPEQGPTYVMGHGSGAPMDSPFMTAMANGLARKGVRVARFEFPYMRKRRTDGRKRAPGAAKQQLACWHEVIRQLPKPLAIGGKSMGGRMASMVADEVSVSALVIFGYPFHPAGKPESLRVEHLRTLSRPTLILQGERDAFGNRPEVDGYRKAGSLNDSIVIHWLPDGDHSFKPRKSSGHTEAGNWETAIDVATKFLFSHQ